MSHTEADLSLLHNKRSLIEGYSQLIQGEIVALQKAAMVAGDS